MPHLDPVVFAAAFFAKALARANGHAPDHLAWRAHRRNVAAIMVSPVTRFSITTTSRGSRRDNNFAIDRAACLSSTAVMNERPPGLSLK